MRIMLIFLGDITYTPLEYQTPKHAPPPDWIPPHGAHRPAAGLDRVPISLPSVSSAAAAVPIHRSTCPALHIHAQPGSIRGLESGFRLTIIPLIVSPNPVGEPPRGRLDSTPLPLWKGGSARRLRGAGRRCLARPKASIPAPRAAAAAAVSRPPERHRFSPSK